MAESDRLDVVDVEGKSSIHQRMFVKYDQHTPDEKFFWEVSERPPMPDNTRKRFNEILGDGNASVSVGMDMKTVASFDSAGCSVHVKLTCNQDEETVMKTHSLAEELAAQFVDQGHARACKILNQARGLPNPETLGGLRPGPAKAKEIIKPKEFAVATPKKKIPVKTGAAKTEAEPTETRPKSTGTKKPSFRRS